MFRLATYDPQSGQIGQSGGQIDQSEWPIWPMHRTETTQRLTYRDYAFTSVPRLPLSHSLGIDDKPRRTPRASVAEDQNSNAVIA